MIQRMFVTLDTKKTNYKNVGKINHGDDLILELTVLSDGDMISFNDPMVDLLVKKSDGKMIRQNSGIEHITPNKFIIEVMKDCVTSPGLSTNQLIINDNGRISTCMFYYTILNSLEEDIIESISSVEVLEQLDEYVIEARERMELLNNDINELEELFGATSDKLLEAENARNEAEQNRIGSEILRVNNENDRIEADNIRNQNEIDRSTSELVREQRESERILNEEERRQNESERMIDESTRQRNENARQSNESIRMSNEADRKIQENRRVTAETNRVNAETTRRNNENSRISNEAERQKAMNEMKSLLGDVRGFDDRIDVIEDEIEEINSSLDNKMSYFDDIEHMILSDVKEGSFCITKGFHYANDGGGAKYRISNKIDSLYEMSYDFGVDKPIGTVIELNNGKYALLHIENNTVSIKQLGAYGDNINDDTKVFKLVEKCKIFYKLEIPAGEYKYTEPLNYDTGSYKEIIGSSSYIAADNYKIGISKLCYYPKLENTTALTFSGTGSKISNLSLEIMDFTKRTTGFISRIDRGSVENIYITNADKIGYILGGRYGKICNIQITSTNEHISYVNEDFNNRSMDCYVVTDEQNIAGGYIPTNQIVENLAIGSPTCFIAKKGVVINGVSLVFENMFNPSCATIPIEFGDKSRNCQLNNCYMEYNSKGKYDYHIIFSTESLGNKVKCLYISDILKVDNKGLLNSYEANTFINELPNVHNINLKENLYNLEFMENGYDGVNVVDKLGKVLTNATSFDDKFSYCSIDGSVSKVEKNSITLRSGTVFKFGIRLMTNTSKKLNEIKGKTILIGCKYNLSSDCDINIKNLTVNSGYGTYCTQNTISTIVKVNTSNTYFYMSLFRCSSPGSVGTITFSDFFIYLLDNDETSNNARPTYYEKGDYIICDSVILKDKNNIPYKLNVESDGSLSTTKIFSVNVACSVGAICIPLSSNLVTNGGSFTFRVEVEKGYDATSISITNVNYNSNLDGSYTISNITSNKVAIVSVEAI